MGKENISSILVKGLDYSRLLSSQGKNIKISGPICFRRQPKKGAPQDISGLADNFGKIIEKFKVDDLLENEDLRKNIYTFLSYLKDEARDKFNRCSKEIANLILRDKTISKINQLDKLRVFFRDLSGDEFSDILWEEAASDKDFDALSFELLSSLWIKISMRAPLRRWPIKSKPKSRWRLIPGRPESLKSFSSPPKTRRKPMTYTVKTWNLYLKTLSLKRPVLAALTFESTRASYHFLILNLLIGEKSKTKLSLLSERVKDELDSVIKNKDAEFLRHFLEICERRRKESGFTGIFEAVKNDALLSIENTIFPGKRLRGI